MKKDPFAALRAAHGADAKPCMLTFADGATVAAVWKADGSLHTADASYPSHAALEQAHPGARLKWVTA